MKAARTAIAILLALAAGALAWRARDGLRVVPDVLALVSMENGGRLMELAAGRAKQGQLLLEGGDEEQLVKVANDLCGRFGLNSAVDFQKTLQYIAPRSRGLVSDETRALLVDGKYDEVSRASASRLFGLAPPLISVKTDPFLLATDYAMSMQSNLAPGWSLRGGYPVCERGDRHFLLMQCGDLTLEKAEEIRLAAERVNGSFAAGVANIWCCGPVFHTAYSTSRAKLEINVLSSVSIMLVVLLGWLLFRSWRFVPQLLVSVGVAFFVATGALFAFFPCPHVLTFVFGVTLIGLAVDYVYHSRSAGGAGKVMRPLSQSLATSLVCFAPLLFADIEALRQMALFTMAGLTGAYLCALAWRPGSFATCNCKGESHSARTRGVWQITGGSLALVALCGVCHMKVTFDPSAFYRPSKFLAEGARRLFETNPMGEGKFVCIKGNTLQESLEIEEAVGLKGLSALIPSLKRQRENAALVEKLKEREGKAYMALTGLKVPSEDERGFLDAENVEDESLGKIVRSFAARNGEIMVSCPDGFKSDDPRVVVLEPRKAMEAMFAKLFLSAGKLFCISSAALAVLLLVFFRKKFFDYSWPVGAAVFCTVGMQGWLGIPLTCFTLLCFFVMIGLGLDYVIFQRSNPAPETRRTVLYSFLSSLAGFGMLAFTGFPVTRAMGLTLAFGLFFAYFISTLPPDHRWKAKKNRADGGAWYAQPERGAGHLRMAFMWGVYRLFGKTALKIAIVPVAACIYAFARPVRRNLRAFYAAVGRKGRIFRHVLDFAWSLADKVDACTLRKDLPRLTVRDDAGGRAFRELVASGKGAFIVSSHVGTVEVLPALAQGGGRVPHVHAFQQMGHDAAFTRQFASHLDTSGLTLHAVEDIGVETAVEMQSAIGNGDLVLMAGDRPSVGSRAVLRHEFLGRECEWPKGVFAFARLMESPVFFVTCVRTGWNAYEAHFEQAAGDVFDAYVRFLEQETRARPDQWHHFHDFFGHA